MLVLDVRSNNLVYQHGIGRNHAGWLFAIVCTVVAQPTFLKCKIIVLLLSTVNVKCKRYNYVERLKELPLQIFQCSTAIQEAINFLV